MTTVLERTALPTAAGGGWAKTVAAARYEYLMQVRRPAVWVVVLALIGLRCAAPFPPGFTTTTDDGKLVADWAFNFIMLGPIGVGAVLADRVWRESRLGLSDLLDSTPTGIGPRLWGKVIGAGAATITPVVVAWVGLLGYLTAQRGAGVIPVGLAAFAAIILPGLVFVAACSVTIPYLTGPGLYRLGLFGYWIWGNMVPPRTGIPTPAGTPFEAIGEYPSGAWFHGVMLDAEHRKITPTTGEAVLSIAFPLLLGLAALVITQLVLTRRSPS